MRYIHPKRFYNKARKNIHDWFWYYLLPDKTYLRIKFRKDYHRRLNLKDPQSYNEKLQWLKLYDRDPKYPLLVDKLRVKPIIKDVIGESHIIKTIGGPWKSTEEIDWNSVPQQFVLKCNHDSGSTVVCTDKAKFDIAMACRKLDECMKIDYYHYENRQWAYKGIERCIFAEQYVTDDKIGDLPDFKFHCCNGKAMCVLVCVGRFSNKNHEAYMNYYDMNWNKLPYQPGFNTIPWEMQKPDGFEEMVTMAEKIAQFVGNVYSRVDFYSVGGKTLFGEITFYPGGGSEELRPVEWDYILGGWIQLPIKNKKRLRIRKGEE